MEIKEQIEAIGLELKTNFAKAAEEQKLLGAASKETSDKVVAMQTQLDALDKKMVDRVVSGAPEKTVLDEMKENEDIQKIFKDKKGRAFITFSGKNASRIWESKTILETGVGLAGAGVVPIERRAGIVQEARRKLTIRDLLSARPTAMPLVYWVKVNSPLTTASPMMQDEGMVKHLNAVTFTTANSPVRTIATTIKASTQILDDWTELGGFLQVGLGYYVNLQEETQLLSGDNTGDNLNGLITQATSFSSSLGANAFTFIDMIGDAIRQIAAANEVAPTFVVLNTADYWKIRRVKDSLGRYLLGDPGVLGEPNMWGLTVAPTNSIASGTFLVGNGDPVCAEIRDRMELRVELSTEDEDNFRRNLVTIRAEKRMVLTVLRPAAFVTGSLSTSP